jgi:hypothetical protein
MSLVHVTSVQGGKCWILVPKLDRHYSLGGRTRLFDKFCKSQVRNLKPWGLYDCRI